jgi:hypothetical protein
MLESQFGNSPIRALMTVYPSHQWLVWKFERVPTNWWASAENQREYMDWLGTRLGVGEMVGWYRISQDDFEDNHGTTYIISVLCANVSRVRGRECVAVQPLFWLRCFCTEECLPRTHLAQMEVLTNQMSGC